MDDMLRRATHSEDFKEQRKMARLDVSIRVQYKIISSEFTAGNSGSGAVEEKRGAITKDMSASGCLLVTSEDLPLGSEVEIRIFLGETDSDAIRLKGRIVRLNRQEKGLYEFGIAFEALSKDMRQRFADYFFSKMYEMIGLPDWPTEKKTKK